MAGHLAKVLAPIEQTNLGHPRRSPWLEFARRGHVPCLGAAVFTSDVERGKRIAIQELHAGAAFVNTFVRSDPRLPFGGIKQSGYGRELARQGILAFVNQKTIYVAG